MKKQYEKLTLNEMRQQIKKELVHILLFTVVTWLVGLFAILNFGWKLGGFIGLVIWLIVLIIVKET